MTQPTPDDLRAAAKRLREDASDLAADALHLSATGWPLSSSRLLGEAARYERVAAWLESLEG